MVNLVYKFRYHGKTRIAVVLQDNGDMLTCWDFTQDDYRNFKISEISDKENITTKDSAVKILDYNASLEQQYLAAGAKVYSGNRTMWITVLE